MKVLLLDDLNQADPSLRQAVESVFGATLAFQPSIQKAIEVIESDPTGIDFTICRYSGNSEALVDVLLKLLLKIPCVLLCDSRLSMKVPPVLAGSDNWLIILPQAASADEVKTAIKTLRNPPMPAVEVPVKTLDADFIRFHAATLQTATPIRADIFARLSTDHYIKLHRKDEAPEATVLMKQLRDKGITHYYIRREEIQSILENKAQAVKKMAQESNPDRAEVERIAEEVVEITQDVVAKVGFTKAIQEVVKNTAQLVVKVVSKNPNLSKILTRLNQNEHRYIASHSMMLGEIACAIAQKIGWDSPATYLKISLAALMHDITLKDNSLAKITRLEGARAPVINLSREQLEEIRMHPSRAAEFAVQFTEIPPDVDSILSQHHERPDGTGFPRKLFHARIHPLAALFIIAHDMLDEFMSGKPIHSIETFFKDNSDQYDQGNFKKIAQAVILNREVS